MDIKSGFLIGDRIVPDNSPCPPDAATIYKFSETVHCLEPGLDRFSRIQAGRVYDGGPLIFKSILFPLGMEEEVIAALLDNKDSVAHIKSVPPALEAGFQMERWRRQEAEKRRLEAERQRREEAERIRREEERQRLYGQLGTADARRALAQTDFATAARAALAVTGAEYLDHRTGYRRDEMVVQYRFRNRRFECVCNKDTLRIVEAGFCLNGYGPRGVAETGDTRFTLESLPAVLNEAINRGLLHVFRHVDTYNEFYGGGGDFEDEDTDY